MRLMAAEAHKLNRPLTWGLAGSAVGFCLLLAFGAAANARAGLSDGPRGWYSAAGVADQLSPAAAGAEAAGLMASMPGALLAALLAGGHIGGEWSGHTLKNLVVHSGSRIRILAAKLAGTWLMLAAISLLCWGALAAGGWLIAEVNGLPHATEAVRGGLSQSVTQQARAGLILGLFAGLGTAAAVITRSAVGTIAASVAALVTLLGLATLPALGRFTPAAWVQSWMGFPSGQKSITTLPTNFWSRFTGSATPVSQTFALAGVAGSIAVLAASAWWLFRRMEVL